MKQFKKGRTIGSIHNQILKEEKRKLIKEIQAKAPQIEKEKVISDFIQQVNLMSWKLRLNLIWRILRKKL